MTADELARKVDHSLLHPQASEADITRLADQARKYRCAAVCVAPVWVRHVSRYLADSDVRICAVVGFPHGTSKPTMKAIEAINAIKDGADEVDVVAFLPYMVERDLVGAKHELSEITRSARATRRDVVIKVIVETALLMGADPEQSEQRLASACQAVRESGCDFIKTSTGFHPAGGASVEAVRLLRKYAGELMVKASGGIRDWPTAVAMLDAGADRLGLSATAEILKQAP